MMVVSACLLGQPVRYDGQSKGIVSDWLRELGARAATARDGEAQYAAEGRRLTRVADPTPEVRQIQQRLVQRRALKPEMQVGKVQDAGHAPSCPVVPAGTSSFSASGSTRT